MGESVEERMQRLQEVFKAAKAIAEATTDLAKLVEEIEALDEVFVSVAYEAASMGVALTDLANGNDLVQWKKWLEYGQAHATQVYIGLGWALGQQQVNLLDFIKAETPILSWRILDGCGYYDGFFRKRKVQQGIYPNTLTDNVLEVYMQGVGRSLWYTTKGKLPKLEKWLLALPKKFLPSLWRGIGIASTYVGGGTTEYWQELYQQADAYQANLLAGAVMAVSSRVQAQTADNCHLGGFETWTAISVTEANLLAENAKKEALSTGDNVYRTWIKSMDDILGNFSLKNL